MARITDTMAGDHRRCDLIFAEAEASVSDSNWDAGTKQFNEFHTAMEHHFSMEEGVLFPTFEEASGMTMGPTQMMRMEHTQMRQLFSDMAQAVEKQDRDAYLGLSETLMMIMQQHNMKEEQMLYPMTDRTFGGGADEVIEKMNAV
ncbi:MAG: hemerythrin domain-containing protein [Gammaproteobacteria bacterium]|nr:hemerythrin domain-containing protein [Gammaproteobacteria bacterium]